MLTLLPATQEGKDYFLSRGLELAKSYGYTTANEGRMFGPMHADLQSAANRGLVDIDVTGWMDYTGRAELDKAFSTGYSNHYRLAGLKVTLDGSPQGRTAWRTIPYLFPPDGQKPGYQGYPAIPDTKQVVAYLDEAFTKGWPVKIELARALAEAGLPKGALNVVTGDGRAVGGTLAGHRDVVALSFTGSHAVGQQIYQQLAPRIARAQMEMGGKNPTFVLADADLDLAARLVAIAGFGLTGQACTATSRVIVERPVLEPFLEKLVAKAQAIRVGNGLAVGITMGPAVNESELQGNLNYLRIALDEGARLVWGGQRLTDGDLAHGWFMQPAILRDVTPGMRIAREEVFGPVVAVLAVDSFDEALAVANGVDVGLSASLVTRDFRKAMLYAERIQAGVVAPGGCSMRRAAIIGLGLALLVLGCDDANQNPFIVRVSDINNGGSTLLADVIQVDDQGLITVPTELVPVVLTNRPYSGSVVTDPGTLWYDFQVKRYYVRWRWVGAPIPGLDLTQFNHVEDTSLLVPFDGEATLFALLVPLSMKTTSPFADLPLTGGAIALTADINLVGAPTLYLPEQTRFEQLLVQLFHGRLHRLRKSRLVHLNQSHAAFLLESWRYNPCLRPRPFRWRTWRRLPML